MTVLRIHIARVLAAIVIGLGSFGAEAQSLPTTAELFAVPEGIGNGEHADPGTNDPTWETLFAPVHGLRQSLAGQGSATLISQIGDGNFATANLVGSGNLAAISQTGAGNRAAQIIEGSNSALLLVQGGAGNSVIQASQGDHNLQLLGVSGAGNQVAYLQHGNNLAGLLNVGGVNSAVLAVQTNDSGRYLMPQGLSGLNNQIVIIGPGRMYVFDRNSLSR